MRHYGWTRDTHKKRSILGFSCKSGLWTLNLYSKNFHFVNVLYTKSAENLSRSSTMFQSTGTFELYLTRSFSSSFVTFHFVWHTFSFGNTSLYCVAHKPKINVSRKEICASNQRNSRMFTTQSAWNASSNKITWMDWLYIVTIGQIMDDPYVYGVFFSPHLWPATIYWLLLLRCCFLLLRPNGIPQFLFVKTIWQMC